MEDDGVCVLNVPNRLQLKKLSQIQAHALQMLSRKNQSVQDIVRTLRIFRDNLDDSDDPSSDEGPSQRVILEGLIVALDRP